MAVSVSSGSITLGIAWNLAQSQSGNPSSTNSGTWSPKLTFTNGTGANSCNEFISLTVTLAASANSTLDLTANSGLFSETVAFTTAKTVVIWNLAYAQTGPDGSSVGANSSSITVGAAASVQAFTAAIPAGILRTNGTLDIPNGGFIAFGVGNAGGFTVGASYKSLKFLNNDATNSAIAVLQIFGTV